MNSLSYLILTEVKGSHISPIEKTADFFLRPAQFLFKGRKVDFIEWQGSIACQTDIVYPIKEGQWIKSAFMVVLLVPSTIIGVLWKSYAIWKYHNKSEDEFIKQHVEKGVFGVVYTSDGAFYKKINEYVALMLATQLSIPKRAKKHGPLFLSEITHIRLRQMNEKRARETVEDINEQNHKILGGIGLLWNLQSINAGNYYEQSKTGNEKNQLLKINPKIIYTKNSADFLIAKSAEAFFQTITA